MRQAALFTPGGIVEINETTGNEAAIGFIADLKETQPNLIAATLTGAGILSARASLAEVAYGRFAAVGSLSINAAVISTSISGWLNELGSSVNLYSSIDEALADDADYVASSSTPGDSVRFSLSDVSNVINPTTVRYRYKKHTDGDVSDTGTVNLQATLQQGTTTIAQWEHDDIGTSFITAEQSLTSDEFNSITDFTDLYLQFATLGGWWLTGASIDLDFENNMHYDSSNPTATFTDLLSCSRASIGYATNADGTLTQFGNDTLRIGVGTGLLCEDARTNLLSQSQSLGTSPWVDGGAHLTITNHTTDVVDPAGGNNATKLVSAAGQDNTVYQSATPGGGAVGGRTFTFSFYARTLSGTVNLPAFGDDELANFWIPDTTTVAVTSTWQRFVLTGTMPASAASNIRPQFGGFSKWTTADTVYIYGVQVEEASFASSYIPTTTTSAARAADDVRPISALQTIFSNTDGSVYVDALDYRVPINNTRIIGDYTGAAVNSQIWHAADNTVATVDSIFTNFLTATLGNSQLFSTGAKVSLGWSASAMSLVGGGGTVLTQAFGGSFLTVSLGNDGSSNYMFGYFRRLTVWNTKLVDATLQALTAP